MSKHWTTEITKVAANEVRLRGYRIEELMGNITFGQAVFLLLMGSLPTHEEEKVIEAILVASIDHGATPPSTLAARTSASTGAPLNACIASGLLSINRHHGAAIEGCMNTIQEALNLAAEQQITYQNAAKKLIKIYNDTRRRIPGLGHRIHSNDPRAIRLFAIADDAGICGRGVAMLKVLQATLADFGKVLPINVDGAIAAVLLDLGVPSTLGNAFFMIARVPGLAAHAYEEATQQRPMRRIDPQNHDYCGPAPRSLA